MSVLNPSQRVRQDVAEECATFAKETALSLGFQHLGITSTTLSDDEEHLLGWLEKGRHGEMAYMARHGVTRSRPEALVPGTISVLSARMDYLPEGISNAESTLADTDLGYISRYALGRDYHKVLRQRLQKLADAIASRFGQFGYRVYTDSAPVLEKALARNAGLGWIGKHTNLIDSRSGSWFFWARSTPISYFRPIHPVQTIAEPARAVWLPVPRKQSSHPTKWMRVVASRI